MSSSEEATFADASGVTDVTLEPGLGTNAYLQLGVRLTPHFTVLGYWDAMRLAESDPVPIGSEHRGLPAEERHGPLRVRLLFGLGQATGE